MTDFSQVLLTVDFDRTLTAPDSTIPERNLEAIEYFIAHGGAFTVNTGRSRPMYLAQMDRVPVNVPWLLYNGSAALSQDGQLLGCRIIPVDPKAMILDLKEKFPSLTVELQGREHHYLFETNANWEGYCQHNGCPWAYASLDHIPQPFLKLALYSSFSDSTVASMYEEVPQELALLEQVTAYIRSQYGHAVEPFRATAKILDLHAKGTSKAASARWLQKTLGRKILVCVGDADNDVAMLRGADFAFCPADGIVAKDFPNVCNCADGAVADVIYEKIPEILGQCP